MNAEKPSVKAIFDEAVEIEDPGAGAYLDGPARATSSSAEAGSPAASLSRRGQFPREAGIAADLTDPFTPSARWPAPPGAPADHRGPGTCIGPYKLLQQIGEGGMGIVFMAEQTEPVRRRVALKLIKPGMDSRQVIARFEAERQALALMDHPNIARVLDAGTTETGRPYFVMELVKGVPITEYCDEHQLTPRERLELFVPVCQAVQHAHQKGIIHRDIKPSNVLVALYDGKPVPKVIDFGVAKATGQRLTEQTLFTEFGAVVGTLEYMSPEQAELNAPRHRHPQRHLLAGRAALRAADRHDAARAQASCEQAALAEMLRRDPRGGAAEAEHAAERVGASAGRRSRRSGRPSRRS